MNDLGTRAAAALMMMLAITGCQPQESSDDPKDQRGSGGAAGGQVQPRKLGTGGAKGTGGSSQGDGEGQGKGGGGGRGGLSDASLPPAKDAAPVNGLSDASLPPAKDAAPVNAPDPNGDPNGDPNRPMYAMGIIPVVLLDIAGKTPDSLRSDPASPGRMRIIEMHDGSHKDLMTAKVSLDVMVDAALHGSSSAGFPQKSFGLSATNKMAPLGMPAGSDFDLIACWTDKPCMRDPLAYEMARAMGQWAPRSRFVEVYFNNQYQGLYQFTEAPKQGKGRVDLPKPAATKADGEITGGYIFRREASGKAGPKGMKDWLSPTTAPDMYGHQMVYTYGYPSEKNITPDQKSYLKDYVARFEATMANTTWNDPQKGYRTWIDVRTWADFGLIQEVSNNVDGYWKSMYMTKLADENGQQGKLLQTPVWDYNIAFGNAEYRDGWKLDNMEYKMNRLGGECTDFVAKAPPVCDVGCCTNTCKTAKCWNLPYLPFWWDRLWSDPAFQKDVRCRYEGLRKTAFTAAFVDKLVTQWSGEIKPLAAARHFAKWTDLRKKVWPNPCGKPQPALGLPDEPCGAATGPVTDFYDHEVKWMRDWTVKRLEWLDKNLFPTACPAP